MAIIDYDKKEVNAKIVYYGPAMSGKTSNIHYIYSKLVPEHRGELMTLSTTSHRTLFFDFLPVELGEVKGLNTRFYLYTVPGQIFYNNIRKQVLKDVDGIVFVADSQTKLKNDNIQSYQNLIENLAEEGRSLKDIPHVIQYNKRDMPEIQTLEDLHRQLNKFNAPFFDCVALSGHNVLKTLTTISKMVLKKLREGGALQAKQGHEGPAETYGLSNEFIAMKVSEANRLKAQMAEQGQPAATPGPPPQAQAPMPPTRAASPPPMPEPIPAPAPPSPAAAPKPAPAPPPPATAPRPAPAPPPPAAAPRPAPAPPPPAAAPRPAPAPPPPIAAPKPTPAPPPPIAAPRPAPAPPPPLIPEPVAKPVPLSVPVAQAMPDAETAPGQLMVARWGNPQVKPGGLLRLPLVLKDMDTGVEYSTSLSIQMGPITPSK